MFFGTLFGSCYELNNDLQNHHRELKLKINSGYSEKFKRMELLSAMDE